MPTFAELLTAFVPEQGVTLSDQWLQGRTAYGGISTALGLVAAQRFQPGLPPLRAAQVNFIAPATGHLRFEPQVLRQGASAVSMGVDIQGQDGLAVRMALVFGQARASAVRQPAAGMPVVRPWPECGEFDLTNAPFAPAFTANFQMRPAGGVMPLSGAQQPEFLIWVRHRDANRVDPLVALVAVADALPPAVFGALRVPAPASSIHWSFEIVDPAPEGEWFLLRSASLQAADGYAVQDMQVWDARGRLLMFGRQSVAVFA